MHVTRVHLNAHHHHPAGTAAKMGRSSTEVHDSLQKVRAALRGGGGSVPPAAAPGGGGRRAVAQVFDETDLDHDGCLTHLEVVKLVRKLLPGELLCCPSLSYPSLSYPSLRGVLDTPCVPQVVGTLFAPTFGMCRCAKQDC